MSETLATELNGLTSRKHLQQKGIAVDTSIPKTTLNGYFRNEPVPVEKAINILESVSDSTFTSQVAYKYLGFIKSLDGALSNVSEAELDIFQQVESDERKECKKRAERLIVESKVRSLDLEELEAVENYGLEYLDEIIVELAYVFKIFEIVGIDISEAMKIKMPQWISKKYMKGEEICR